MFSIAMSGDGKTVAAGGKHVHARMFGNGGDVYNISVDLGGGAISGTILLGGIPPNHSGTTVRVLGTTRTGTTLPNGQYIVSNVPSGTYSLRISHLGYVGQTLSSVAVTGSDTTRNVNATLAQAGAAPTNLIASGGQNSRIVLGWTNPTSAADKAFDKETPPLIEVPRLDRAISVLHSGRELSSVALPRFSDLIPPDSIKVYRAIRTGGPYYLKRILSGAVTSYIDSAVLPLRDYYYRVTAINGQGESQYSNEAHGTVDSSFLQFSITTPHRVSAPTIDGVLAPGEWADALRIDISDVFGNGSGTPLPRGSAFMWFKYDSVASKLYVAGEDFLNTDGLVNNEGFGLYFDDNHNRKYEPQGTDPLLREGNYWGLYLSSGTVLRFRELFTGGGASAIIDTVTDGQVAFSTATGHVTGEVSIPISFFNKNHLQVFGPDKKVGAGIYMRGVSGAGASLFHGWWPQTLVDLFNPSGFGDIRIPIRLLAAPRAPSNIAITRQASRLRVTWTDPTLGINGDPMTVPVTLQLYRNDVLWREFPVRVQGWTDSNVVAQGWYEYKMRGYMNVAQSLTTYFGPYSTPVGLFAVSDPQLTEVVYDDGIPDAFYVVDFTYNDNKFGIRFTPQDYPARVYRVKAFTNNGNSPIRVAIHADSSGLPGQLLAGQYTGVTHQTTGVDSFLVTLPGIDPPAIESGSFWVVLSYLPSSPGAPGIGADRTPPLDGVSYFYNASSGWQQLTGNDLMVRVFITGQRTSVGGGKETPKEFALLQNYPNPFNPRTVIKFQLPSSRFVTLRVYDLLGREVATLVNEEKPPGDYQVAWDASSMASGVYLYRLSTTDFVQTRKLVLLR
jgi:hypothetical protein